MTVPLRFRCLRQIAVAFALTALLSAPASSEMAKLKVATQIGLSYLPLIIMQHDKLWEKQANSLGAIVESW